MKARNKIARVLYTIAGLAFLAVLFVAPLRWPLFYTLRLPGELHGGRFGYLMMIEIGLNPTFGSNLPGGLGTSVLLMISGVLQVGTTLWGISNPRHSRLLLMAIVVFGAQLISVNLARIAILSIMGSREYVWGQGAVVILAACTLLLVGGVLGSGNCTAMENA